MTRTCRPDAQNAYVYRHLSSDQAAKLAVSRSTIARLESSYTGLLLLTESEYCLLLPLLNPVVIAQNRRRFKELCSVVDVSKKNRTRMVRNLWLQSCMGFIPVVNVLFTRRFKCNTRNLAILEAQIQDEEDKEDDGVLLPPHIARMFGKSQAYAHEPAAAPDTRRHSAAATIYHSACVSLLDLGAGPAPENAVPACR
ncbi:hypothetical protein H4R18_003838 [Coemansia javaensis]|uniref:Uncharacterized protein n=1 Tax=Coemansia javaensis TaxID=2761396 RepID=A0A9W8HCI7_9FUNG|nr:hypothetical protein H4R18_003838 [Coemansia javaensis]